MPNNKRNDIYEAMTYEEWKQKGSAEIRRDELRIEDKHVRDENAMLASGLWGSCVVN